MEKFFKQLEAYRARFQELEKLLESDIQTKQKEGTLYLLGYLEKLMDEVRDTERHFFAPTNLPLSVEIWDALKELKRKLNLETPIVA